MAALLILGPGAYLFLEYDSFPGHAYAVDFFLRRLGAADPPFAAHPPPGLARGTVLYVLGGACGSLYRKFKVAALRYRIGECARVIVFQEPGKSDFQPSLGRDITKDAWAIEQLMSQGVRREDIELLTVAPGLWGTLNEAREVTTLVRRRGSRGLILVTSLPHTRRVRDAFSCLLRGANVEMRVLATDEVFSLRELMVEYLKLTLYNDILLPRNCGSGPNGPSPGKGFR